LRKCYGSLLFKGKYQGAVEVVTAVTVTEVTVFLEGVISANPWESVGICGNPWESVKSVGTGGLSALFFSIKFL